MSDADAIRRIVIFADGTGNAFSTQASNIWRLYEALDLSGPDQVAHYIKGVGTSGFRPFAIFDGATGVGVPANVRKLHRFLSWNWRPGVDIYLFGFSRGAFTIRTLIGLVASQGLMPTIVGGAPVSRAEMKRNTMAAWRAYRKHSVPPGRVLFTITWTRAGRDGLLALWHRLGRHRPYAEVAAERDRQARGTIPIAFAGLFDTVEAYGVPVAELRAPIDKAIWPMSFRNRVLSPIVRRARHALSLDDERTTFHPVRFDMHGDDPVEPSARIREVWFAGVHSDVGGGYPDDALAHVALAWMLKEAEAGVPPGRDPLRFRPGDRAALCAEASPLAAVHDSRAGLSTLYRYDPRRLDQGKASGGPPIVHHSVAEKMVFGTEGYAPLTLPSAARVLMPDGHLHAIAGFEAQRYRAQAALRLQADPTLRERAEEAVERLAKPNPHYVELTRDTIWWRRVCYFVLLGFAALSLALPATAGWLDRQSIAALAAAAHLVGWDEAAGAWRQQLTDAKGGLGSNLNDLSATFGSFVPGYAKGWVQALVDQPIAALAVLGFTLALYRISGTLRDKIADHARCAWFIDADGRPQSRAPRPWTARLARRLRTSGRLRRVRTFVFGRLVPAAALAIFALACLVILDRAVVSYRSGSGNLCTDSDKPDGLRHPKEGAANLADAFPTDNPCWPTGIVLEKGRSYRIWIAMEKPYLDGRAVVGVDGYTGASLPFDIGWLGRRWWGADWFQPIARIGATGNVEWPLASAEGVTAPPLADAAFLAGTNWRNAADRPSPSDALSSEVAAITTRQAVRRGFVAQFTAQGTGELFLFVNDVILAVPLVPNLTWFYANNSGTAKVTVELLPPPSPPPADPYDFSIKG